MVPEISLQYQLSNTPERAPDLNECAHSQSRFQGAGWDQHRAVSLKLAVVVAARFAAVTALNIVMGYGPSEI